MPYFDRLDIVEAYYLFLSHYHEGMGSDKYERLSRVTGYFSPSPTLRYDSLTLNGKAIYDNLVNKYMD